MEEKRAPAIVQYCGQLKRKEIKDVLNSSESAVMKVMLVCLHMIPAMNIIYFSPLTDHEQLCAVKCLFILLCKKNSDLFSVIYKEYEIIDVLFLRTVI